MHRRQERAACNIWVDSRELGDGEPRYRRADDADKQLARVEPPVLNTDAELGFTPTADGVYRVEVHDLHEGSGPRHVFRLRIAPPEPDFDLSVLTDRFTLAPGKPLNIPVTIVRRGGFAKDPEFIAEGLSKDVKVEVVPPPKGQTNAITLRLSTDKPGTSGAFRIVGRAKEPAILRMARVPLGEFEGMPPHLWLAVGGDMPVAVPKKKR